MMHPAGPSASETVFRRFHRIGPGRFGLYTIHRGIERNQAHNMRRLMAGRYCWETSLRRNKRSILARIRDAIAARMKVDAEDAEHNKIKGALS